MNYITESELNDAIQNQTVKAMKIILKDNGSFETLISVARKKDMILVTTRGNIKQWVSLDRYVSHLKNQHTEKLKFPINLQL